MQIVDVSMQHTYLTAVNGGDSMGAVSKDEATKYMVYFTYSIASNGLTMTLNKAYTNALFNVNPRRVYGVNIAE